MTTKTKQIEEKFNKTFPTIRQASLGDAEPRQFNKDRFLKAAKELQKVVKDNDKREPSKH
ncbi:MAG TPA: hypothetical protein VMR45_04980 [Patescibacteria group bacterium]|nr:hypothetical protein [Patescibacteria group bacterium]